MIVKDNFLEKIEFKNIKNEIESENFPWFFSNEKNPENENFYNYQFYHIFYQNYSINSQYFDLISPLIKKINPLSIIKIKANLTPNIGDIYQYGFHKDLSERCKTSIFYINSNNGYTIFENGEKVDSIENRFLSFDSFLLHSGTTCTDKKFRCLLNINYIPREY